MAETRFGGDVRIYGKGFVESQGAGDTAIVARKLLADQIVQAEDRANHTGTQLFSTISDGKSYVDGRITDLINAAPGALDTLGEIATALTAGDTAAAALTATVGQLRTDHDTLAGRVTNHDTLIGDLRHDVDGHTGDISLLRTDLTSTQNNVTTNTGAIATLRSDLTSTQSAATALTARVATNETNITGLRSDLTASDTRIAGEQTAQDGLIAGLRTDADKLRADLDAATGAGGGAGDSLTKLRTDLTALTTRVTQAESDIDANYAAFAKFAADLASTVYKETVGDGSATLLSINHNLGTTDVEVLVRDLTDGQRTFPVDIVTGANSVDLDFGSFVPATDSIRVAIRALGVPTVV